MRPNSTHGAIQGAAEVQGRLEGRVQAAIPSHQRHRDVLHLALHQKTVPGGEGGEGEEWLGR